MPIKKQAINAALSVERAIAARRLVKAALLLSLPKIVPVVSLVLVLGIMATSFNENAMLDSYYKWISLGIAIADLLTVWFFSYKNLKIDPGFYRK